jgi:Outer membrane lipoprotein
MSDLKLVAPNQPSPLERLLLDAAANESPSAEQRMRVRAALGLSVVAAPPAPVARAGRITSLGKAAIGGAVAASAVVALMLLGVLHKPATAPLPLAVAAPTLVPSVPSPAPQLQAPAAAEPVASPLPPVEPKSDSVASASAVLPKAARSVSSVSKSPAPADSATDSGEQLLLIDAARSAVAAGNASAASQALSTYSAKFPHGSFGQEAAVLRIETVDLAGNHAQAASLARTFLAQHPNSPHVSLVQRIANRAQ